MKVVEAFSRNSLFCLLKKLISNSLSQYLSESMQKCGKEGEGDDVPEVSSEKGVLHLLLAWKNLTLILAAPKVKNACSRSCILFCDFT